MTALPPALLQPACLTITIGAYLFGVALHRRWRSPLCNPVLIAIILIATTLHLTHLPYAQYFAGAQLIHFLLGPATVALAIPLVLSLEVMRQRLLPMLLALAAGSVVGFLTGPLLVRLCGGPSLLALSMAPKSLTTPIAIGVAQGIGGNPSLTAVLAILGGILVAITIDPLLRLLHIHDPAARGLAAGTAGSGIGAAQVIPQHSVAAAFAGVAIGMNGLLTAALAPLLVHLIHS